MPVVLQFPGLPPSSVPTLGGGVGVNAQIIAGDQQSAVGGQFLPIPLQVLVTDQLGKPLSGQSVTYTVTSGGGSLSSGGNATTDSRGIAAVSWTLGSTVGLQTVSVNPHTGQTLGFSATATQQISASLSTVSATSPITLSGGTAVATVTVTVLDTFGNPVVGVKPFWNPPGSTILTGMGPTNSAGVSVGTATFVAAADRLIVIMVNGVTLLQQPTVVVLGGVSASLSTVSATSPVNVNTLDTVTVTAKDSASHLLSGKTVTLSVSGTGNTVNQPGSPTDSSGVATGSFQSSVAETKVITAVAGGVTITQQPSVVVQSGSGPTPILSEHFNWANQSAFLSDTTIYSNEDPYNTDATTNLLNTSPVFGNGVKSYEGLYAAQPSNCSDYTPCGRNLKLPSDQSEIWIDSYWLFSAGFTTLNPIGCASGQAQKLLFGRVRGTSRFQIIAGSNGGQIWETGYPGNEEPTAGQVPTSTFNMDQFADGSTVLRLRAHWRIATSGIVCEMWMQNTKVISLSGDSSQGSAIYGIAYLRNLNQGPPATQNIRIGSFDVYNTDPGW